MNTWDSRLDAALSSEAPPSRPTGIMDVITRALDRFSMMDPEYARRRERERVRPLEEERLRLQNRLYQSQYDDLTRERAERAAAGPAVERLYGVAQEREPVIEWGEEEGAGVTRAQAGQKAARTLQEILKRGGSPRDAYLAEQYAPKAYAGLGLQSPADIEKADAETVAVPSGSSLVRRRTGEVVTQGKPNLKTELKAGKDGYYAVTTDDQGNVVSTNKVEGVEPSESKGVFTRADVEATLEEAGWKKGMPGYAKAYANLARQFAVPPGGAVYGAGQLVIPPPPAKTSPTAAPTPGPKRGQQPIPPAARPNLKPTADGGGDALGGMTTLPYDAATPGPMTTLPGDGGDAGVEGGIERVSGPRPLIERAPAASEATNYIHRQTLQPPPPGMTKSQIEASGQYVQASTQAQGLVRPYQTIKTTLDRLEDILERREDLFPKASGNAYVDTVNVAKAKAKFFALRAAGIDADVKLLGQMEATLPTIARFFGDTGNIAVAERVINKEAVGLSPMTAQAAQQMIDQMREYANASGSTVGLPKLERRRAGTFDALPDPAKYKGKIARDEKTGKRFKSDGTRWVPEP